MAELIETHPDQVLRGVSQKRAEHAVGQCQSPVRTRHRDADRGILEDRAQTRLAVLELFLRQMTRGDVDIRAPIAQEGAVPGQDGQPVSEDPDRLAVPAPDGIGKIDEVKSALEGLKSLRLESVLVRRRHKIEEVLPPDQLLGPIAPHRLHRRAEIGEQTPRIHLPGHGPTLQGELVIAAVALAQGRIGTRTLQRTDQDAGKDTEETDLGPGPVPLLVDRVEADETVQAVIPQQGDQHERLDGLAFQDLALRRPLAGEIRDLRDHDGLALFKGLNRGGIMLDRVLLQLLDHGLDPCGDPFVTVAHGVGREIEAKDIGPVGPGQGADAREGLVDQGIEILVMDLDERGGQLEQLALQSLALNQIQLSLFAGGDVLMNSRHAQGSAVLIARRDPSLIADPDPMAIVMPHPHLAEIPVGLSGEMTRNLGIGADEILGVTEVPPGPDGRRREILRAVADHLSPARIQNQSVSDKIELPGADPGRVDDVRETSPLLGQGDFDLFACRDVAPDRDDRANGTCFVQNRPVRPLQPTPPLNRPGLLLDETGEGRHGERTHGFLGAGLILRMH